MFRDASRAEGAQQSIDARRQRRPASTIRRTIRAIRGATTLATGFALLLLPAMLTPPAQACIGPPPPPICGKTLVWTHAGPPTLLLPNGGTFLIPGLLFFNLVEFPAGAGICPGGPYEATVTLSVTCTPGSGIPGGDGGGSITVPIGTGYTDVSVPVTLPPGPPRICTVTGTAVTTLGDGMVLEATSDSVMCLAEAAPGNPNLPRLDLEPIGLPGSEIARVHPGDQATYRYRITNNDPTESFAGTLEVESRNTSRLPTVSGPMPPGTGPFSVSDPGTGDNFPVGFADDLFLGCVVIPPDPLDPLPATIERDIMLAPGESIDVPVFARPFGGCASGSCSRGTVVLDGTFAAADPALACTGFVTAADTGVTPTYLWPDSGEAAKPEAPSPDSITLSANPDPEEAPLRFDFSPSQLTVMEDDVPVAVTPGFFAGTVEPERGRIQVQLVDKFQFDALFDIGLEVDLALQNPALDWEVAELVLVTSITTAGIGSVAPVGRGRITVDDPTDALDANFDFLFQASAVGIDAQGTRRDLNLESVTMERRADGTGFRTRLVGRIAPGPGSVLDALEIALDFRGFASPEPQGTFIFEDGFESGNVIRWSNATP